MNIFNALTLKQVFWEIKTFFEKLEYRLTVESTMIESATFLFKTAMSKVNVKTNRMGSTKWTYHKERSFATTLPFLKIEIEYENLLQIVNLM